MCAWRVVGDTFNSNSELSTGKSQEVQFNDSVVIRYIRTWIIIHNPDNFTNLKLAIHADDNGSVGPQIIDSLNSWAKADLTTENYALKEIWFRYTPTSFNGNIKYHFVLTGTGTNFSGSKNIAWRRGWPDNVYRTGLALDYEEKLVSPFCHYEIGAEY